MFKGVGVRAALTATGAVVSALMLASCGGGQQVERYVPTRLVSFGDENSAIVDVNSDRNGAKYTVNALKDPTTTAGAVVLDCATNPVWNQYVGQAYGLVFPECNPSSVATSSRNLSVLGALASGTSNSVQSQIDSFVATDKFDSKTLVTIMAGQNDVLAQYAAFKAGTISADQAQANVEQAGSNLAAQVNRIADLGGKVLIATMLDQGTTPYGLAEEAAVAGRSAFLTLLSTRFNSKMRIGLVNDGTRIGLVLADEGISGNIKSTSSTFTNLTQAACDSTKAASALQCTTSTLVTGGSGDTYMWADDRHLSAGGQRVVGGLAATRASGNPF
jgi:lysophospholipase L1-like esterase